MMGLRPVDDHLEPCCLSQRQLTWPDAIEDFRDLLGRGRINYARPIIFMTWPPATPHCTENQEIPRPHIRT
jgi:hypothetical protein